MGTIAKRTEEQKMTLQEIYQFQLANIGYGDYAFKHKAWIVEKYLAAVRKRK